MVSFSCSCNLTSSSTNFIFSVKGVSLFFHFDTNASFIWSLLFHSDAQQKIAWVLAQTSPTELPGSLQWCLKFSHISLYSLMMFFIHYFSSFTTFNTVINSFFLIYVLFLTVHKSHHLMFFPVVLPHCSSLLFLNLKLGPGSPFFLLPASPQFSYHN